MAMAAPMSSIRPQQRQVRPLFSSSLTTHETFRRNCKVSAEQDKSKWSDPGLAALVMLLRFHGLRPRADLNAERLEKTELLDKQPLCSLAQIRKCFGLVSVEFAIPHRTDGRAFDHLPGRPGNGLGIEPKV